MDPLLEAVKSGSLESVERVVSSMGIPLDRRWIDYLAVNQAIVDEHVDIVNYLLDNYCRVKNNHPNVSPHETPLHSAVKRNMPEVVARLLDKGASSAILNGHGYSPLHLALILGHDLVIDVFLNDIVRTDKYVNARSDDGLTHFHVACTRRNLDAIEGFIESGVELDEAVNFDSDYRPGYTARHFAAEFQSLEAVRALAKITGRERSCVLDKNGKSAEDLARKNLEELSVMVYLLSGESRPNSRGSDARMSQFHVACTQDNPRLVKKFIENGAAVNNHVSEDVTVCPGYSPLHCAVESNCRENVELLLKENAEVDHQDANYATPLHLALYNEDPKKNRTVVDLLYETLSVEEKMFNIMDAYGLNYFHMAVTRNELDVVKAFLDAGENIEHEVLYNQRQFAYYRPLHFAVRYGHPEMTELLLDRGADPGAISKDGAPLHIAFEVGNEAIVDLLLKCKTKVNEVRRIDGKTMLHSLVETFMTKCEKFLCVEDEKGCAWLTYIERLAKLGCNVNHRDDNGNTPLHIACEKIFYGIPCVRLLLNCGGDVNMENADGETPFECAFHDSYRMNADSYMLLYHQVQKLKVLGFSVNPKNEVCCQRILDESNECDPGAECFRIATLDEMKMKRREEIMKMMGVKLTKAMSLCGFLRLSKINAAAYVTNETLQAIINNDEKLDEKYPVYGYLIRLQFQKGTRYLDHRPNNASEHSDDESRVAKRQRCD